MSPLLAANILVRATVFSVLVHLYNATGNLLYALFSALFVLHTFFWARRVFQESRALAQPVEVEERTAGFYGDEGGDLDGVPDADSRDVL